MFTVAEKMLLAYSKHGLLNHPNIYLGFGLIFGISTNKLQCCSLEVKLVQVSAFWESHFIISYLLAKHRVPKCLRLKLTEVVSCFRAVIMVN